MAYTESHATVLRWKHSDLLMVRQTNRLLILTIRIRISSSSAFARYGGLDHPSLELAAAQGEFDFEQ
jgi:hypothetical protein